MMGQDAGFRCLFTLTDVKPIFVASSELFDDPRAVIRKIADALRAPINAAELDQAVALGQPYGGARKTIPSKLSERFKRIAFGGAD